MIYTIHQMLRKVEVKEYEITWYVARIRQTKLQSKNTRERDNFGIDVRIILKLLLEK
jgi:hypothetical protein